MERKLASIQRVRDVRPIEGADVIEVVQINNWNVVCKKGEYKPGDLCIYCEIDSFLPIKEEFEFLRKSSYRKLADGSEGFRLKTIKLRGQVSQGLVLPLETLNCAEEMVVGVSEQPWGEQLQLGPYDDALVIEEGLDVSKHLGIIKYEPPVPASLAGVAKGLFPSFIPKTDEERVQNLTNEYEGYTKTSFYVTEKLDGSSFTAYVKDGEFGICSRNLELLETEDNTMWKVARELDLETKMRSLGKNVSFQGEIIGEGIQGNPYRLKGQTLKFFNIFDIDEHQYYIKAQLEKTINELGLETVPMLHNHFLLPNTIEELLQFAEGKSALCESTEREGLVIRNMVRSISFKVISNKFLLKGGD
jgi:RNA ligase (TIGR02306 family)